jgi:hypothetical protein
MYDIADLLLCILGLRDPVSDVMLNIQVLHGAPND